MMRQAGVDIYTYSISMMANSLDCKKDIQDMKVPILLLQCNNRIQFQNISTCCEISPAKLAQLAQNVL